MTEEDIKWVLNNLSPQQKDVIEFYCKDDSRELRKIGIKTWMKFGVPQSDYGDLYDDAVKVLIESIAFYDPKKESKFSTYLRTNIRMSAGEWYRNRYLRAKRNNLVIENDKIKTEKGFDGKERPIIIPNVWLDATNEDGMDMKEIIPDKTTVEDVVFGSLEIERDSRLDQYLNKLPVRLRRVARLLALGYTRREVKNHLHIEDKDLADIMAGLKSYEYISIFFKKEE